MPLISRESWFVAVLVFESSVLEVRSDSRVDLQFRLIRAGDADGAYARAMALGAGEQHSYANDEGNTCVWTFKGLEDLQEVIDEELDDGMEIYGFIEDGTAEDRVVPKELLTVFLGR